MYTISRHILVAVLIGFFPFAFGQQGDGGNPNGLKLFATELYELQPHVFEEPDVELLRSEDEQIDGKGIAPWRFGFNHTVSLSTLNSGTWIELPNGDELWLLKLNCVQAKTVNLTFHKTIIPDGNELYVYNEEKSWILGKFTAYHLYEGMLGTELLPGNSVIVEYYVPKQNKANKGHIEISTVTHGYRTAAEFQLKAFGDAGACNMNVNCPDGAVWTNQRNSVVMLVSGSNGFCTGALINNTLNDGKPYILTANHCYSNPASWVFRFNWQAESCANPVSSPTFESLSGAVLRARRTPSDMCLVEITGGLVDNTVPESYNPFFAGWNRSNTPPTATIGIHHPRGDIKKISFDDNPAVAVQEMGSTEPESSWQVVWDRNTTTEQASSGSPLFDQNGRIIGQLWGGQASCTNLTAPDFYGRIHNSWEPVGSTETNQLKHWLDPTNSGVEAIDGLDLGVPPLDLDGALSQPKGASGTVCGSQITPSVTLINLGLDVITSATISYHINGGPNQQMNWTGSLSRYQSEIIELDEQTLTDGSYTFTAEVTTVNGVADENAANNTVSSSFTIVTGGVFIDLKLQLDCDGSENSWTLTDSEGLIIDQGGPYTNNFANPQLISKEWCVVNGCYGFTINDSYGDGISAPGFCSTTGYIEITNEDGEMLAELPQSEANFGNSKTLIFCTDGSNSSDNANNIGQFELYPNPVTDYLTIELQSVDVEIVIINSVGQTIYRQQAQETLISIPMHNQPSGMYFVKIGNHITKLSVMR